MVTALFLIIHTPSAEVLHLVGESLHGGFGGAVGSSVKFWGQNEAIWPFKERNCPEAINCSAPSLKSIQPSCVVMSHSENAQEVKFFYI